MDIWEIYSRALAQYQAENYDAALKILDDLKRRAPDYRKAYSLEVCIWEKIGDPVKEFYALEKILPLFDLSVPEEKKFAADALTRMGNDLSALFMAEETVKFLRAAAQITADDAVACAKLSTAIFKACGIENFSADDFRALYDDYKKHLADITPYPKKFYNHDKIRVGFLSADFRQHVAMNWLWSLITGLNKNFFAVHCYSSTRKFDVVTNHLREIVDGWHDIHSLTDAQAAKVIRGDEIDILFDLSGHTAGNRLRVAAYRPATIQISGIGYMNSTGLDAIDYFLSDVHCAGDASAMRDYFTEKIIIMPHSHICYEFDAQPNFAAMPPCLKNGHVTFGTFNNFSKVTDSILRAWKKILDAVPDSRLLLKHKIFDTAYGRNFVGERLKNFGIDTARVDMRGFTTNYLDDYADVDIALDTFPYTGGVTTCEALYMGVPVISLYGGRHGSRFGLSILKNVGLDELAVDSVDDYVRRAVMLAGDWELLNDLRRNLRGMMKRSPLMNSINYVRDVEKIFVKILRDERLNGDFGNG